MEIIPYWKYFGLSSLLHVSSHDPKFWAIWLCFRTCLRRRFELADEEVKTKYGVKSTSGLTFYSFSFRFLVAF